jgi:hypothetical protein
MKLVNLVPGKQINVKKAAINEDFGTIAIGIMLAWAGIKVLKFVAKKLFAGIGSNMELTPERLKRATVEMVKSISSETNIGASILMGHYLTKLINADIDSGKIKTINDIEKSMRDYLKSNDSKNESINESLEDLDTTLPVNVERYLDKMVSQIKGLNLNRKKEILVLAKVIDAMGMDKQELMRYIQQIKKKDILGK